MKFVTTEQAHRRLVLESDEDGNPTKVVSSTPLQVSEADATKIEKIATDTGVRVRFYDDEAEAAAAGTVATPTPDLSAGVAAIAGTGSPVTNEPEQPAKIKKAGN